MRVKRRCRGRFSEAEAVAGAAVVVDGYHGRSGVEEGRVGSPVGCQGDGHWLLGSAVAIG